MTVSPCFFLQNGIVEVSFRDRFGNVDRSTLRLHYEDLVLAEPPKKELAMVLSGKYKGVTGIVRVSYPILFEFIRRLLLICVWS